MTTDAHRQFSAYWSNEIYNFRVAHGATFHNHFSRYGYKEALRRSLLGECMFGDLSGAEINTELLMYGDGGKDFILPFRNRWQVFRPYQLDLKSKTVRTSWHGLLKSGTHLRVRTDELRRKTIYIFATYFEWCDEANVHRWHWGEALLRRNRIRVFNDVGAPCYTLEYERLRGLDELLARMY
jgi:hypothetical protein